MVVTVHYYYHLLNVFAREGDSFSGNPLCVFEDGAGLNAASLQAIARQFNLSETTFLFPSTVATAKVRIFTPDFEMPFAGHPTLGSAHVVRLLRSAANNPDAITLEMAAGIIPVSAQGDLWTLKANKASSREFGGSNRELAKALGLAEGDMCFDATGDRPLWMDSGTEQLIVPLRHPDLVRRARPMPDALQMLRNQRDRTSVLVFAEQSPGNLLARYFFEADAATREDPATGSACANLGNWCLAVGCTVPLQLSVSQGEQVLRPSTLRLRISASGEVFVGGLVTYLGRGEIFLSP